MNPIHSFIVDIKFTLLQQLPNILIFFTIVLGSWLIQHYLIKNLLKRLALHYSRKQMDLKKEICDVIEKPASNLFFATGFLIACGYALNESLFGYDPLLRIFKTLLLFFFFQSLYYITNYLGEHPEILKINFNIKSESMLVPFFARIVKVFIFVLGFVMIAYEWGYDINGFVAGLGIGGLALALGAKDVLSHIFAGIALSIDKPFNIGDLISTDSNLEGTVEDMNFRSTKVRTLDKALVSVPNAVIANQYIYNWTRRQNRRVRFLLGLPHDTTGEQIDKFVQRTKTVIINHTGIELDSVTVSFDSYTPNSFDVLIQYVTNTSDYNEFVVIKEEINFLILEIMKDEGLKLARIPQDLFVTNTLS